MTKEQIEQLKKDMIIMGDAIIRADKLIIQLTDRTLQQHYREQLKVLLDAYHEMDNLLKQSLDDYIAFETAQGNVIDFKIRKLKQVMEK